MEIGMVQRVDIDHEMQQSYLDYAMSVIVSRALPDARDGLKPVQRRILYAMYDMGIRPDSAFKKSARIVGEVMGKYHPHGDQAIYEAMARMAQDFSMRGMLVDGQGNFGSVDGDPPAAMRYTEARLSPMAMELLLQIDRETVNFTRNFDDTLNEPEVLPAALPNLLVNGANGIAVGMATSIPPHNLGEVVDALVYLLREWERTDEISVTDLMRFIQGPDFPTGGIVLLEEEKNELITAYATGRGRIRVRGRAHVEDMGRGKSRIIITELPYQANKANLIERIAELVRDGQLDGIGDLRDESDRQGMRIVIELSKSAEADTILRELYKRTPLESAFGIFLLALVGGEPRLLTLKQALHVYLEHRLEVVRRRSEYDLRKAKERAHILEGLLIALKNLDEVIATIRNAPDVETARMRLMKRFKLSETQTQAILDMQLRRLAALERRKIEQEYKDLLALIKELEGLLRSPRKIRQVVESELMTIKQNYTDRRRTQIVALGEGAVAKDLLTTTDMMPAQAVWVGVTPEGRIGRTSTDDLPRVSGRLAPRWLVRTDTHHTLYLVSREGRAAAIAVHALPEVEKFADGVPVYKACPLTDEEQLAAMFSVPQRAEGLAERFVVTVTRAGMVKKTALDELPGPSAQSFTLAKINAGDALQWALLTNGSDNLLLVTRKGMGIVFSEQEVRPMGLLAAGVNGIKLGAGDEVTAAVRLNSSEEALIVASSGEAWRLAAAEFPVQGRYGQGVMIARLKAGVGLVGAMAGTHTQMGFVHFQQAAARALRLDEINESRRARAGSDLASLKGGDTVTAVAQAFDSLAYWEGRKPAAVKAKRSPGKEPVQDESKQPGLLPVSAEKKRAPARKTEEPVKEKRKEPRSTTETKTTAKKAAEPKKKPAAKAGSSSKPAAGSQKETRTKAAPDDKAPAHAAAQPAASVPARKPGKTAVKPVVKKNTAEPQLPLELEKPERKPARKKPADK